MDFLNVYLPISGIEFSVIILLIIGFCVGTLGGFFGVGGAWIVTPALNIFGFNMPFAIGTDLAHIFGKSIIATKKHSKMGNVDWRLGLFSIAGSIVGIELGKRTVLYLEKIGDVGSVIRWVYMVFLFGLGIYMAYEYYSVTKKMKSEAPDNLKAEAPTREEASPLSNKLRSLKIPPMVSLPVSGVPGISFWILFGLFALTGFLSGFMGVGGGFILLPALIYLIGCPTTVAVGTSLLSVCFMSGYGCFTYSLSGRTELVAAVIMLFGAAIGAQVGAMATKLVRGYGIRLLFAIMIIFAGISVALKQAHSAFGYEIFGTLAAYCVMGAAGGMTALIFIKLIIGYRSKGAA
ncbi:MAG: sulfite exporter TauE/SafE family protein [Candidatus Zixiibacteriota bacterium]|nr:MAG: sulfite exporter TauE/SafE family protein [candidate division Zixibacteria bacterium]